VLEGRGQRFVVVRLRDRGRQRVYGTRAAIAIMAIPTTAYTDSLISGAIGFVPWTTATPDEAL